MGINTKAVEDSVVDEQYYVFPGTTMTVCCLTVKLPTGTANAVGHSDCIDPDEFDVEKGRLVARKRAMDSVFGMLGTYVKLGGTL